MQTLKRARASALNRDEFEFEARGETPDLKAFENTPLARLVKKPKVRGRLDANIGVDVSRDVSVIKVEKSKIEASRDNGEIRSNGASLPFGESELELKEGEADALFEQARRLCEETPISLSFISKAREAISWRMEPGGAHSRVAGPISKAR